VVEHFLGKEEVPGSNPGVGSKCMRAAAIDNALVPVITRYGVRMHYSDTGVGPAVFFHTGGGGDGTMWEAAGYLDALPGRHHLLFDHRGHGRSDQPRRLESHRLDEYIADAIAVLDSAGVARAAMVGYSDGARLIYALAARHPERVSAIAGIGGVAHPTDTEDGRRELAAEVRQIGFHEWLERMSASETEPTGVVGKRTTCEASCRPTICFE
jgi:pimeloyl-ACP methyl ester carboxylesterase